MNPVPPSERRSDCPISVALDMLGDRWTLLILRDLFFKRLSTSREFLESGEGIATNILADRLKRLVSYGILTARVSPEDGRVTVYRPTAKGLDLLPVLIELILWAARHEDTAAPPRLVRRIEDDPQAFAQEIRDRFAE